MFTEKQSNEEPKEDGRKILSVREKICGCEGGKETINPGDNSFRGRKRKRRRRKMIKKMKKKEAGKGGEVDGSERRERERERDTMLHKIPKAR